MKVKIIILFLNFSFLLAARVVSQTNLEWARYYNSTSNVHEEARSVCLDDTLNVLVAAGKKILKYDPSGNLIWNFNLINNDQPLKIVPIQGNFFVAANKSILKFSNPNNQTLIYSIPPIQYSYDYLTDIQPGENYALYSVANVNGGIVTKKFNTNGDSLWTKVKPRTGSRSYRSYSFFLNSENRINIIGSFTDYFSGFLYTGATFLSYDPSGNLTYNGVPPAGSIIGTKGNYLNTNYFTGQWEYSTWHSEILLYKMNSGYSVTDTIRYNGIGNGRDEPNDILTDIAGNIYIACRSWGVSVGYDFVVLKFDHDLNLIWEYRYNGSENSYDEAKILTFDNHGNVFASGIVTMNAHGIQIYTVKLSPSGQLLWYDRFSRYNSITDSNYVNDIKSDNYGHIYLCGKSRDSVARKYDNLILKYSNPTSIQNQNEVIEEYSLFQNFPNPFNPVTNIKFKLAKSSDVKIRIFSSDSKVLMTLVDSKLSAGDHTIKWDANNLPSGVYFISFESNQFKKISKAVLIK